MSYFDHVQCSSCGARIDPERLVPGPGDMPACPYCRASLNLTDLFGVKDAFVGMDDGLGNEHSLDDLVGGELYDGRYIDGRPPPAQAPPPARPAAVRPAAPRPSAPRGLPGPAAPSASAPHALVRQPKPADDTPAPPPPRRRPGKAPSASDLLREMKKKR